MNSPKRNRTEAVDNGDDALISKPGKHASTGRKKLKQTGDKVDSVLGNNQIEDVRWLCSLSESELDLLICLKMMGLRRAKRVHPGLANNFNLKELRELSLTMMEKLKDEVKDVSDVDKFSQVLGRSNLSQVNVTESFSSMTAEELWPFICRDMESRGLAANDQERLHMYDFIPKGKVKEKTKCSTED